MSVAATPFFDTLKKKYPTMTLSASGEVVGLPWGELGNSEVGHLSIGSGKILYQSLPRINKSIMDGSFYRNEGFLSAINHVRQYSSRLHMMGLIGTGGVHAHEDHLFALLELCVKEKMNNIVVHVIFDGRDSGYKDGRRALERLEKRLRETGVGRIGSLSGRFWAMDRDNHWDRTQRAYEAIIDGISAAQFEKPLDALEASYARSVYDEEFEPAVMIENMQPVGRANNYDAFLFFNFRPDRARQLTKALSITGFPKFKRARELKDIHVVTMTEYEKDLPVVVAFPPEYIDRPLARVLSDAGLTQLHIAETEKYAHVTFFFNGGVEKAFPGEERILVPSKQVSSYDQKPAMSANDIVDRLLPEIEAKKYDFIVVNFANADMVAHTGNFPKIVEALQFLDECNRKVVEATWKNGGVALLTSDHGNAEEAVDPQTGEILKDHTTNPVPFVIADPTLRGTPGTFGVSGDDLSVFTPVGVLADVAPTILALLGIEKPLDMTGRSLL